MVGIEALRLAPQHRERFMSLQLQLSDLTRLDKIRTTLAENDPRRQFSALGMDQLVIDEDALGDLVCHIVYMRAALDCTDGVDEADLQAPTYSSLC